MKHIQDMIKTQPEFAEGGRVHAMRAKLTVCHEVGLDDRLGQKSQEAAGKMAKRYLTEFLLGPIRQELHDILMCRRLWREIYLQCPDTRPIQELRG